MAIPKKPTSPTSSHRFNRILIIVPQLLGDAVISSVLVTALKKLIPSCTIDVLVTRALADVFLHNPAVQKVHVFDSHWRRVGLLRSAKPRITLIRGLRRRCYDLLIQSPHTTDGSWGPALILLLAIPCAVGGSEHMHGSPLKRWIWRRVFSHRLDPSHPQQRSRHVAEVHLDLLRRIGLHPALEDRGALLFPGARAKEDVRQKLASLRIGTGNFVLFAPSAGNEGRTLDRELCRQFIDHCVVTGQVVVVITGATPREKLFAESICGQQGPLVHNLAGQFSIAELIALAGEARLFVGTDSGPMHIAAAMHVPVIVCFGPGDEQRFGPWQTSHQIISSSRSCRPCDQNGCGNSGRSDCLLAITPLMMTTALDQFLRTATAKFPIPVISNR